MGEVAFRQAILHGLIAAGFVEALLRTWRMARAESRIPFWTLALISPLVAPLFRVALPFRATDAFAARWALFSSARWSDVRVAGAGVDAIVFDLLAAAGLVLFLRDAAPFLLEAWRERREEAWSRAACPPSLVTLVADLSQALGIAPPAITVVASDERVFFVRGLVRHHLVVSREVLATLDDVRLRAAVAHELAHIAQRDPRSGWFLMAARLVMCWNPAVQLLARAVVQEMERRADAVAAALTTPADVSAALACLALPAKEGVGPAPRSRSLRTLTEHLDVEDIRARSAALLAGVALETPPLAGRLAITGAGLAGLLFFVV